jgi:hypothetical protein
MVGGYPRWKLDARGPEHPVKDWVFWPSAQERAAGEGLVKLFGMSHSSINPVLLSALVLLGAGCGSKNSTPTPASNAGDTTAGGGGTSGNTGSTGGTGSTGSIGSTGLSGSSGSSGSTGTVTCGPAAGGSTTTHTLTVSWSFPVGQSCTALAGDVTRIAIQVYGVTQAIETGCAGDANQSSVVAPLVPGTWAVAVRATDSAGKVNYAGVTSITMGTSDLNIHLALAAGDVPTASKICGLPR